MAKQADRPHSLLVLVVVSLCALGALTMVSLLSPHVHDGGAWRQPLTGLIFSVVCVLGMVAVFFPQRCARRPSSRSNDQYEAPSQRQDVSHTTSALAGVTLTHGHHFPCERYHQHEFHIGKKTLCAACMGLFTGALISLIAADYVFVLQRPFNLPYGLASAAGALGVMVGVLSYAVADVHGPGRRFFVNAIMIVGILLALIGADGSSQSLALNLLLIGSCTLALFARILLSQDRHERICRACEQPCAAC